MHSLFSALMVCFLNGRINCVIDCPRDGRATISATQSYATDTHATVLKNMVSADNQPFYQIKVLTLSSYPDFGKAWRSLGMRHWQSLI